MTVEKQNGQPSQDGGQVVLEAVHQAVKHH